MSGAGWEAFRDVLVDAIFAHWPFDEEAALGDVAILAAAIDEGIERLPVEQRMEAMGMVELGYRARMKDQTRVWKEADA
jgi:hypothetical protein